MGNSQSSRSIGQKRALIFGFDYSGLNKLNGPVNDGNYAASVLINTYGFLKENVTVLNSGDILTPMSQFIKSSVDGDMNVIHYSGHGEYINGNDNLVRDDLATISSITVSNLLYTALGNFLIVVDACDSGSIVNLPYVCDNNNNNITQVNNNSFTCSVVNFSAAGRTQNSYETDQGNGIVYGDFSYEFYNYLSKYPSYNWLSIFDGVYNDLKSIENPNLNCSNMQLYYQQADTFI